MAQLDRPIKTHNNKTLQTHLHSLLDVLEKDSMDKDDLVEERETLRRDLRIVSKDLEVMKMICTSQQQAIGDLQCRTFVLNRDIMLRDELLRQIAIHAKTEEDHRDILQSTEGASRSIAVTR